MISQKVKDQFWGDCIYGFECLKTDAIYVQQ